MLVQFAMKMKRLVAFCIVSGQLDGTLMNDISFRIVETVVPLRPALWAHLGAGWPDRSDPDVPAIHFNETMIDHDFYFPPPF